MGSFIVGVRRAIMLLDQRRNAVPPPPAPTVYLNTTPGTAVFTIEADTTAKIECVGGGGGTGGAAPATTSGGAGGGGYGFNVTTLVAGDYTVTVGGGGSAGADALTNGTDGGESHVLDPDTALVCDGFGGTLGYATGNIGDGDNGVGGQSDYAGTFGSDGHRGSLSGEPDDGAGGASGLPPYGAGANGGSGSAGHAGGAGMVRITFPFP